MFLPAPLSIVRRNQFGRAISGHELEHNKLTAETSMTMNQCRMQSKIKEHTSR